MKIFRIITKGVRLATSRSGFHAWLLVGNREKKKNI